MKQLFRTTALVLIGLFAMSVPTWACTGMYLSLYTHLDVYKRQLNDFFRCKLMP